MKHSLKHKILLSLATVVALFTVTGTAFAGAANCSDPTSAAFTNACCPTGQVAVQIQNDRSCCPSNSALNSAKNDGQKAKVCLYGKYLNPIINLLSAMVGVVVVVGIIVGAIQFSSSAGDPQKAANGKNHIRNALLGLLAYILLYAFLQFMLPGGALN